MISAGDIHLADLNEERRRRVLVVSNERFHGISGRVLVAPELIGDPVAIPFPWRITIGEGVYAVDMVRGLVIERLLERCDCAPAAAMTAVRRALLHIT